MGEGERETERSGEVEIEETERVHRERCGLLLCFGFLSLFLSAFFLLFFSFFLYVMNHFLAIYTAVQFFTTSILKTKTEFGGAQFVSLRSTSPSLINQF